MGFVINYVASNLSVKEHAEGLSLPYKRKEASYWPKYTLTFLFYFVRIEATANLQN